MAIANPERCNVTHFLYVGSQHFPIGVTLKVRSYADAEELAYRMRDSMGCRIYYSAPDSPQDGWFIVSTEPIESSSDPIAGT